MAKGGFTERDYLAVAKKSIVRAQNIPQYPKLLFYARKKQGKTTLAMTAGAPHEILIIDPEKGAEYKREFNPYIWPITQWEDMQDVYGALRTGKLTPKYLNMGDKQDEPFKWVVVDGLTRINNFALHFVRREQEERDLSRHPGFVDRRDYGKSGELLKQMLTNFHGLKMGVIYTAQEKMKTLGEWDDDDDDTEGSEVIYIPEIPDAVRNQVNSLVDVIGRVYTVRVEIKGEMVTRRRLRIGVSDKYDTGARTEYDLPEVLKSPTVPKLLQLMSEGA